MHLTPLALTRIQVIETRTDDSMAYFLKRCHYAYCMCAGLLLLGGCDQDSSQGSNASGEKSAIVSLSAAAAQAGVDCDTGTVAPASIYSIPIASLPVGPLPANSLSPHF